MEGSQLNKARLLIIPVLFTVAYFSFSCEKKKTPPACEMPVLPTTSCSPSYSTEIRPFVLTKCAVSGCHGTGASFGDFTAYNALKSRVDNGRLFSFVYELKLMPPASAIKPSEEELDKLKCWINNGGPQN